MYFSNNKRNFLYVASSKDIEKEIYKEASKEWPNINWHYIEFLEKNEFGSGELVTFPFDHNVIMFKHVFPSVLKYMEINGTSFLIDGFIYYSLDIDNIWDEWKLDFYLAFPDDVSKIVALILNKSKDLPWVERALESYWIKFLKN